MASLQTVVTDSAPESLYELCFEYLATHLEAISVVDPQTKERRLKEGVTLPLYFCEKLVELQQWLGESLEDGFMTIFENTETSLLKKVRLRNTGITDRGLLILLRHNLEELELDECKSLTEDSLRHINEFGDNLSSLVVGRLLHVLGLTNPFKPSAITLNHLDLLQTPNLRRLTVRDVRTSSSCFPLLLKPLPNLDHLDLSGCRDVGDLSYLCELENLSSLILHDVEDMRDKITSICMLKKLRHLDISTSNAVIGKFPNPNQTLALIVECLPLLTSLDISGTNLAGTGTEKDSTASKTQSETGHQNTAPRTDIPGLASRVNNPLEFLGLYRTHHHACHRRSIPAKKISGDANEGQIMTAAAVYIDRPMVLVNLIDDLSTLYMDENEAFSNFCRVLDFLLGAMDRHVQNWDIQYNASNLLLDIIHRKMFPTRMMRKIVKTTLKLMNYHRDDERITKKFIIVLNACNPMDLLFQNEQIIDRLTNVLLNNRLSHTLHEYGIGLLSSLAFYGDDDYQRLLGEVGMIKAMLSVIEDRTEKKMYDLVFKNACDIIFAATGNTYENCQRFVDGNGLDIILRCIKDVIDEREVFCQMVNQFEDVAEIESLRPRMMTSQLVTVFLDLLDSVSDDIEVTYVLVTVLSYLASDGPAAWTIRNPKREDVLRRMVSSIESWDLTEHIYINSCLLESILPLVQVYHTPECQHWAVWTLAHLTHVDPSFYCPIVEEKGFIPLLEEVLTREEPYPRIKELADMVIRKCQQHNRAVAT